MGRPLASIIMPPFLRYSLLYATVEITVDQAEGAMVDRVYISVDEYLEQYAGERYEWVRGALVPMPPTSLSHQDIVLYLVMLLRAYLTLRPIGRMIGDGLTIQLPGVESRRQPDGQIILHTNPGTLTETMMIGAPDIVIEVVSRESVTRDYGEKFEEYERGRVPEYWIIDPLRQVCHFHRLQATSLYAPVQPNEAGEYRTPLLPNLALHVPTLWQQPLPDILRVVEAVQKMVSPS